MLNPAITSVALTVALVLATPVAAAERVDYLRDVKPILEKHCYACHGALKQKSDLRLDTGALVRAGGDSGPVIEPGNATESLLIERVTADDEADRMPPEGRALSRSEIAILRAWIDQGARSPSDERAEPSAREHWAFLRPRRPALPALPAEPDATDIDRSSHPIDRFLAALRREHGLKTVSPAGKRTLLRRLHLDLIGLPPTRAELEAFETETRQDAFERIVDRLLSSPQHGERWARHWMDVWRYTDWYGLGAQLRYSQKHIWHWRDWIIQSLNEDKGYDRMILEMLAADELTPSDPDALRATGFLARNYFLFNRTTWLDTTIEHTAKAFLGLTMNCAKCHDHKYDPIRQVDYYRLRAFFEPHQVRLDALPGETDLEKNGIARVFDAHLDAPTYLHIRGDAKDLDTSRSLRPGVPEVLAFEAAMSGELKITPVSLPPEAYRPALKTFVLEDHLRVARAGIEKARAVRDLARAKSASRAGGGGDRGKREQPAATGTSGVTEQTELATARLALQLAERTLAAAELRPAALRSAHAADVAKHRPTPPHELKSLVASAALAARGHELAVSRVRVLETEKKVREADRENKPPKERQQAEKARQDALAKFSDAREALSRPGDRYPSLRASLKALEGPDEPAASRRKPYPRTSTGRRTALARWIVDERNPLTARVAVNHIWLRHFGQPLVDSVADFGLRAARPAHQALLDWLAVELMESGWSMKHLHRLIVTSRVYRMSSSTLGADSATRQADPENVYYWRRRPVRMESQVIRDALLHLAGRLDGSIGGPSLDPDRAKDPQREDTALRRSIYFTHSRDGRDKLLSMFDDADILACYRRSESIVPQQALALSNGRLARRMARELMTRLARELGNVEDDRFLEAAYVAILAVKPTAEEISACREALADTKEALAGSPTDSPGMLEPPELTARARENLVHALFNHNDFITIR